MAGQTGGSSTAIPDQEEHSDAVISAGNAADNKERKARWNQMRMLTERKRRSRVSNYLAELQALMPHVTDKSDKKTIVGQVIDYIESLEKTKATLEKRKQELAMVRQVAAEGAASSSSAPLQSVQDMAATAAVAAMLSLDIPDSCHDVPVPPLQPSAAAVPMSAYVPPQQPLATAVPVPGPPPPLPQLPMAAAGQVGFRTWSSENLVLNVSNDNAYINVCLPRHLGIRTQTMVMVLSVLNKYGIDVVSAQVDSDAVRSVFNIFAHVTKMAAENLSSEEVYKLAMSEIQLLLNTN